MNKTYHINCKNEDIGKVCILPGDPGRCESIAAFLESPRFIASNREFVTYTGYLNGAKVSVVSTGIGGPSAVIALEELSAIGADTFIRIGTCGGIDQKVKSGDLVIAMSAVRQEGTSREYAPLEYPATADFSLVCALKNAADALNLNSHVGVVQSKDSFYGQHSPERMPVSHELLEKWQAWKRLGVLCSEMECAALFTAAAALKLRCAAVLHTIWNTERKKAGLFEEDNFNFKNAVHACIEAIKIIPDNS